MHEVNDIFYAERTQGGIAFPEKLCARPHSLPPLHVWKFCLLTNQLFSIEE